MIYLAFYRGEGRPLSDTLVKWVTRSEFSHCELLISNRPPKSGETHRCVTAQGKHGGVCVRDLYFREGAYEFVQVPWAPHDTFERAAQHLGRGYDYWGLLMSQFINLRRHVQDRWFCSKLCAQALGLSEAHTYAPGDLKRIVEEHNRVYRMAHLTAGQSAGAQGVSTALPATPPAPANEPGYPATGLSALARQGRSALQGAGLALNDAGNHLAVSDGEGQRQAHVQQAGQNFVRPRQGLRPRVSPAVVARGKGFGLGRAEPFKLHAAGGASGGKLLDFRPRSLGQPELDG